MIYVPQIYSPNLAPRPRIFENCANRRNGNEDERTKLYSRISRASLEKTRAKTRVAGPTRIRRFFFDEIGRPFWEFLKTTDRDF